MRAHTDETRDAAAWRCASADRRPGYYKVMGRNEYEDEIDYVFDES